MNHKDKALEFLRISEMSNPISTVQLPLARAFIHVLIWAVEEWVNRSNHGN